MAPLQESRDKRRFWLALSAIFVFVAAGLIAISLATTPAAQLRAGVFIVFTLSVTVFLRAILILLVDRDLSHEMLVTSLLAAVIGWLIVMMSWGYYSEKDQLILILVVSMTMLLVALVLLLTS